MCSPGWWDVFVCAVIVVGIAVQWRYLRLARRVRRHAISIAARVTAAAAHIHAGTASLRADFTALQAENAALRKLLSEHGIEG